jgi:glucose dehydrogenase
VERGVAGEPLSANGKATPMSYQLASGDQVVAISAGGGGVAGRRGCAIMASGK